MFYNFIKMESWYVSFCFFLPPPIIVFLRFIHVDHVAIVYSFCCIIFHCRKRPHFINPRIYEYSGCFQDFPFTNVAVNILVHASVHTSCHFWLSMLMCQLKLGGAAPSLYYNTINRYVQKKKKDYFEHTESGMSGQAGIQQAVGHVDYSTSQGKRLVGR